MGKASMPQVCWIASMGWLDQGTEKENPRGMVKSLQPVMSATRRQATEMQVSQR